MYNNIYEEWYSMREILLTMVLTMVVCFVCGILKCDINNKYIAIIVNSIPAMIPFVYMFMTSPKILLKRSCMGRRDIFYNIKFVLTVDVSENELNSIFSSIWSDGDRVIKENIGEYIYIQELELNRSLVSVNYDFHLQKLFIEIKQDITIGKFKKKISKYYECLQEWGRNKHIENQDVELKLVFGENEDENNLFVKSIFKDFDTYKFDFEYTGKNDSIIIIKNNSIQFKADNFQKIIYDVQDNLYFNIINRVQ